MQITDEQYADSFAAMKRLLEIDLTLEDSITQADQIIREKILIPHFIMDIPINTPIYRARANKNCSYSFKSEISYNNKVSTINKLGRANYYHQSTFYGAFKIETAIFETSINTRDEIKHSQEFVTIGRWIVVKPLKVFAIVNDPDFLDRNSEMAEAWQSLSSKYPDFKNPLIQKHLEFISDQFAKKVAKGKDYLYKLSIAFFTIMMQTGITQEVGGVVYPSVEYEKRDLNIALLPEFVDEYLVLDSIYEHRITIDENLGTLIPSSVGDVQSFRMTPINQNQI